METSLHTAKPKKGKKKKKKKLYFRLSTRLVLNKASASGLGVSPKIQTEMCPPYFQLLLAIMTGSYANPLVVCSVFLPSANVTDLIFNIHSTSHQITASETPTQIRHNELDIEPPSRRLLPTNSHILHKLEKSYEKILIIP